MEILWDKRESDRKCLNHARAHASAQSFDRCESLTTEFFPESKQSRLRERKKINKLFTGLGRSV